MLKLLKIEGYMVGNKFIPTSQLEKDQIEWAGTSRTPIIGQHYRDIEDEFIFRLLAFGVMPFAIEAKVPQTVLQVQIARFPYTIDGVPAYWEFGIRISPNFGRIARISLLPNASVAMNHFESGPGFLFFNLAGSLKGEIYYSVRHFESMPPMQPREGFRAERYSDSLTEM